MIHLRTPYKINSMPACIIDPESFDTNKIREAYAMECNKASKLADGREIWITYAFPKYSRLNAEHINLQYDQYMIKIGPGSEDDDSRMLLQNDRFFVNFKANKCLTFSNEKYIANESNLIQS